MTIDRQQVVIENKPGAGGNIGADAAARAEPDGYTMLIASFPHAVARFLYPALGYDLVTGFAPVTLIGFTPNIMVVPNSSPARSVGEFIAHAKASKLAFASSGVVSTMNKRTIAGGSTWTRSRSSRQRSALPAF